MKVQKGNKNSNYRHGSCVGGIQPIYAIWQAMKTRCLCKTNIRYKDYGQRGIKICDDWLDFNKFREWSLKNGYCKGKTLDRINNDKGYCPENCRFANYTEQANNKRNNHFIEYNGEKNTIAQWSKKLGLSIGTLESRINKLHWPIELALSKEKNTKLRERKKIMERGE